MGAWLDGVFVFGHGVDCFWHFPGMAFEGGITLQTISIIKDAGRHGVFYFDDTSLAFGSYNCLAG